VPLQVSVILLAIVQLQFFDTIDIDYIGLITPPTILSNCKYMTIAVDYFSQFLFSQAMTNPTDKYILQLL